MTDRVGQQLGNYRLISFIGQGSFADVYLAEHIHLQSQAAIKILKVMLSNEHKAAFLTEARRLVRLRHSHIVRLLEFGIAGDVPFLVMEYASNGSLRTRHPKGSQLPLETVVFYIKHAADALQYIHEQKLVHRDIKPENMLLGSNQEVMGSDLGIAAVAHNTSSQSVQTMAGTVPYMAPEMLQGKPRPASDQYALGIVAYEWICGERPFRGSFTELYSQQLFVPPPSLHEKVPELPPDVEDVVLTALAKDPQQRFSKIQAFAVALEQASHLKQLHPSTSILKVIVPNPVTPSVESSMSTTVGQTFVVPAPQKVDGSPLNSVPMQLATESKSANPISAHGNSEAATFIPSTPRSDHSDKLPVSLASSDTLPVNLLAMQQNSVKSITVDARSPVTRSAINNYVPPTSVRSVGGRGKSSRKPRWHLLVGILIILIGIIALVGPSVINPVRNFVSGASPLTTMKIILTSKDLKNTYIISAVTSNPDASQHQVQARLLSYSKPSQSKTVNATGVKTIPGVQATGKLTFYNGSLRQQTIAVGTIFKGSDGVQVINDELAIIPAAKPPVEGSVSVAAHVVNTGKSGNIRALDIHMACCISGDFIIVENLFAFSGGRDDKHFSVVQQSDIDGIVNSDTQNANISLQSQVRPNERFVSPAQCTSKVSSDHAVGDKATNVRVTTSITCTGEVYDQQAAQTMAAKLLKSEATRSLGASYTLAGQVVTSVIQAKVVDKKETISLLVKAEGMWTPRKH